MRPRGNVLRDARRRAILDMLSGGPRTPREFAEDLGAAWRAIAPHVRMLTQLGLVRLRRGRRGPSYYLVRDEVDRAS